ncbi:hypothetical protein EV361DRAFT_978731, partial [Lentinula raphanica]
RGIVQWLRHFTQQASIATITSNTNPLTEALWENPWSPPKALDRIPIFFSIERSKAIFDTVGQLYQDQSHIECPSLWISGASIDDLVETLKSNIRLAIEDNNWETILSPHRHFIQNWTDISGREHTVTSGPGLEQSVLNALFKEYFVDRASEFCTPLFEDFDTLIVLPQTSGPTYISEDRKEELSIFGAVTALALIHGHYPGRLSPLLLIYLLNGCDIRSLHRKLVYEYSTELGSTLDAWLCIGPDDNVLEFASHFASYHNTQVAALNGRSLSGHRQLAFEMLQCAAIGPIGVNNAFFQAFCRGFRMQCNEQTIDLYTIVQSFCGGAEEFVQSAETSIIKEYDDLNLRMHANLGPDLQQKLSDAFAHAGPDFEGKTFEEMFREFLEATGAPCPQLLESIKDRFSPKIDLNDITSPTFRMKLLCWSVTGAPRIIHEGDPLRVQLVEDDNEFYISPRTQMEQRDEYISLGTCSFKTCTRSLRIPASYLIKLLHASYNPFSEYDSAKTAIHHWLLVQMLDAIESYTIA